MAHTKPEEIKAALAQPFAPEDLEWRLQTALEDKLRGLAVPYVTNRAIQSRLDEVVGPENWCNDYKPWHSANKKDAQICGISIYFENRGWVTKWDGAEDTDIEPVKGGLSDSMKRAAVQWGIGRVLYNMDTVWVGIEKRGKSFAICDSERPKLDKAYINMLDKVKQLPASATGTQAQLTPAPSGKDTAPKQGSHAPAQSAPPAPKQETPATPQPPVTPAIPKLVEPNYDYIVEYAKVQKGMNSESTTVVLKAKDGKSIKAFARGAHDGLQRGTKLANVKLEVMKQNSVVFNVLRSYEIAPPLKQAA